jgi:hypothetical protein
MLLAVPLEGHTNLDATITPAPCQAPLPPLTTCPKVEAEDETEGVVDIETYNE